VSIAKSSFLFSAGTFLSRISGLIRDQVVLGVYGATIYQDAFIIAFRIPNLLREIFAEGALGSSFTKVYSSLKVEDEQRARILLLQALYFTLILSLIICCLGLFFASDLVGGMTLLKKSAEEKQLLVDQATKLTRLLFPYLGFTIMSAVVMGALHQKGKFFLSAVSPIMFNLGNIVGALFFSRALEWYCPAWLSQVIAEPKISGLAFGVLIGGALHFGMMLYGIKKELKAGGISLRKLPWSEDLRKVLVLMTPAALAASTGPFNLFINTNFASSLSPGVITWLNTAFRLLQLPIGVFAVAVGVSALPRLSRAITHSKKEITTEVSREFQAACELVLWLLIPCMIFLVISSTPLTRLLFEHGNFTTNDSIGTGSAMFAYSFGIIGYGLIKVLSSFYYAVERTSYAMFVAIACVCVNFAGNYFLVDTFGHMGLAYTSSLTLSVNALLLILGLRRHQIKWDYVSLRKTVLLLALAAGLCIVMHHAYQGSLERVLESFNLYHKISAVALVGLNGILILTVFLVLSLLHIGAPILKMLRRR
jgi:putative peptidoglycan lipid II flippase